MYKTFTSILFFTLSIGLFAQQLPSLENTNLPKGLSRLSLKKFQSVTYREYRVENDTISPVEQTNESYYFSDGILSQKSKIDPVSKSIIYTKKYDAYGRIVSEKFFAKNAFKPISIYIYDEPKRTISMFVLNNDSFLIQKRINFFDPKNKLIRTEVFDRTDISLCSYSFYYNRKGDLTKTCFYNTPNGPGTNLDASFTKEKPVFKPTPNDSTIYKYKYNWIRKTTTKDQYDARLRPISRTIYASKKDTMLTIEYSILEDFKNPISRKTTKIIQNKRIELNQHFDDHQNISSWSKFIYVDDDYMEGNSNSTEKSVYRHEYLFDQYGNWIVKFRYDNDKLWSVTKREIKYK